MAWPTFDQREDVPEQFREEYHEKDGKFVAKLPDNTALKKALDEEKAARSKAEDGLKKASDDNKSLKDRLATAGELDGAKLEEVKARWLKEEVEPLKSELEDLRSRNEKLTKEDAAVGIAGQKGVMADRLKQWWTLTGDRFDTLKDGTLVVKGAPEKDVDKFIAEELKKEFPYMYQGTNGDGGDAGGVKSVPSGTASMPFEDLLKNPGAAIEAANAATK